MSRSLRFDAAAERELNEAVDFYNLESSGLGDVFLSEVEHALAQVTAFLLAPRRRGPHPRGLSSEAPTVLLEGSPVSAANKRIEQNARRSAARRQVGRVCSCAVR